ncbi:MAG: Glutamate--tRNA ligase [Methanonatronarchaeales archaeon]|nr:Glutamate--tRNA ligase [Methanonatronarchaeales archaeon]
MEPERQAFLYALQNAVEHGEAREGPVMGYLLGENPELRSDVEGARRISAGAVKRVNSLSADDRARRLREMDPSFFEGEREERELPDLPGDTSSAVLRFAPNPSGPLHLGHARAAVLNDHYAERYGGELFLRFEDTDPSRVDPKAYELIEGDLAWLGVEPDKTVFQSDRIEVYHEYAEKLVEVEGAYVCTCPEEEFHELRNAAEECPCRPLPVDKNRERFERMFDDYGEGEAAVRVRTDVEHPDPALRDFPAMRISEAPHPRVDARVYPLMNLSVAVDDHLLGVTHVIRGKDHLANTRRQLFIYEHLGWEPPEYVHHGHLHVGGVVLSTSEIRTRIDDGQYGGWDDIELGTLRAIGRRGIRPKAVRETVLSHGLSENDAEFSWKNLYAANRKLVDDGSDRYFFVPGPATLRVEGPGFEATPPLHPDHPERGTREIEVSEDPVLVVPSGDADDLSVGDRLRLKDLYNLEVTSTDPLRANYVGNDLSILKDGVPILQWLPADSPETRVLKPDGDDSGALEPAAADLKVGDIVQFERYGFCRLDEVSPPVFCYAHA